MKKTAVKILCAVLLAAMLCPVISGCSGEIIKGFFGKSSLVISEVCSSNSASLVDEDFGSPDWIELYNSGSEAIDLTNYALSNDPKNPTKYMMPQILIQPGEYLLIYATKLESPDPITKPATGFKLASGGMTLYLTSAGGDTLYKLEVPALARDTAYSVLEDGTYKVNGNPTPGAANVIVDSNGAAVNEMDISTAPLIITEYMIYNGYSVKDEDGERPAWVEITNNSTQAVSLLQYRLSDNVEKPAKWAFPDVTVQPGERLVVFCSGKDKVTESGQLHTNFKLSGSDTHLILMDMESMQEQKISLPADMKENISCGIKDGQWLFFAQPTPGKENTTKGFTLMSDFSGAFDPNGLSVSEVCTVNSYGSTALSWIELYNGSDAAINLNGYFLSDSLDEPTRAQIGNVTVPAKGYVAISVTGNDRKQSGSTLDLGLDAAGENIVLTSPEGSVLDVFATGAQRPGVTSGRIAGDASGERVFFTSETKGKANPSSGYKAYVAQPQFSAPGGVQTSASVSVEISCATEGASIYYTTDGSKPTSSNGKLYTGPVSGSQSFSLRAIAVKDGLLSSDVETSTYLFTEPHSVPVVCLSMAPNEFSTMYANTLTYRTIERPGVIEYYDTDGSLGVSFGASVRVSGWSSRSFNQKSLTFKLDEAYGKDHITYPFFEGYDTETFYSITMRAGGQDRWKAYIRDAFLSKLVATSDVIDGDAPMTRYAVLYVNGRYWGLYDLREEINKDMLASHHDEDVHTVNYLRRAVAQYGSIDEWKRITAYSRANNLANPDKYAEYCQWVDASAWADYLVLRNYFRETDMFNQKYWHTDDYSTKLRPIYFDNDYSLYDSAALTSNLIGTYLSYSGYTTRNGTYVSMDVTAGLWQSPEFQELFKKRWLLLTTTEFKPENLLPMLDAMVAEMEPEMSRQISRWGAPSSMSKWKSSVEEFRSLLQKRPTSARKLIEKYFSLTAEDLEMYK